MSSRLFQEVRERRGQGLLGLLVPARRYRDAGYLGRLRRAPARSGSREVVDVIRAELRRDRGATGLSAAELARTKNQIKGSMLLGLETSDSRMSRIAQNEIYFGRDVPLEEVAAAIDAVTNDDVVRVAQRIFRPGTLAAHGARRPEGRAPRRRGPAARERDGGAGRGRARAAGPAPLAAAALHERRRRRAWTCSPTSTQRGRARAGRARASCRPALAIALPPGYEAQVRPRSGLALRARRHVLNAPGTDRRRLPRRGAGAAGESRTGAGDAAPRRSHRAARGRAGRARRVARGRGAARERRAATAASGAPGREAARDRPLHAPGDGAALVRRGAARALARGRAGAGRGARRARRGAGRGGAHAARATRASNVARMQEIEAEVKHDVIAFVSSVAETRRRRGPLPAPRPHVVATCSTPRSRCSCATPPICCSRALDRLRAAVRHAGASATATRR